LPAARPLVGALQLEDGSVVDEPDPERLADEENFGAGGEASEITELAVG